jgi:hypothetical protein
MLASEKSFRRSAMNQMNVVNEQSALQAQSLDLRSKLDTAEKGIAWFTAHPGGTVEDAKRLKEELTTELQKVEDKRSALLQQILHGGGIGFDGD